MGSRRFPAILIVCALSLAACRDDQEEGGGPDAAPACAEPVTTEAAPFPSLRLGLAGAPVSLFGPEGAPLFADVFAEIAAAGFDLYFPYFGIRELDGQATVSKHFEHFLPDLGDPTQQSWSCRSGHNPYAAADGRLEVLFPAFLFAGDFSAPFDRDTFHALFDLWETQCLAGHEGVVGAYQLHDEPATSFAAGLFDDPDATLHIDNVAALADAMRTRSDRPLVLVEAVLPSIFELQPDLEAQVTATQKEKLLDDFWHGVELTAPAADAYGFDVYPVGTSSDLGYGGRYVDEAERLAPGKTPLAVLQGFGGDDMFGDGKRRPTEDETRVMAFDAVVHGAGLLLWWGQSAMGLEDPGHWESIKAVAGELRELAPVLTGRRFAVATGVAEVSATGRVDGTRAWIFVTNPSQEATTIELAVPRLDEVSSRFEVSDWRSGGALATGTLDCEAAITLSVPAYGTHVLAIDYRP